MTEAPRELVAFDHDFCGHLPIDLSGRRRQCTRIPLHVPISDLGLRIHVFMPSAIDFRASAYRNPMMQTLMRYPLARTPAAFSVGFIISCAFCASVLLENRLAFSQDQKPPETLTELQERLAAHVSNPRFAAALWGVKIVSLESGRLLFETNAHKLFSPASNSKLYTVA